MSYLEEQNAHTPYSPDYGVRDFFFSSPGEEAETGWAEVFKWIHGLSASVISELVTFPLIVILESM